jgi:GAF domain-containing protein
MLRLNSTIRTVVFFPPPTFLFLFFFLFLPPLLHLVLFLLVFVVLDTMFILIHQYNSFCFNREQRDLFLSRTSSLPDKFGPVSNASSIAPNSSNMMIVVEDQDLDDLATTRERSRTESSLPSSVVVKDSATPGHLPRNSLASMQGFASDSIGGVSNLKGRLSDDRSSWTVSSNIGFAGWVYRTGQSLRVANASIDSRFDASYDEQFDYHTLAVICAPIVDSQGQTIAVLEARNKKSGVRQVFDESDLTLLSTFCSESSTILRKHLIDTMLEHQRLKFSAADRLVELIRITICQFCLLQSFLLAMLSLFIIWRVFHFFFFSAVQINLTTTLDFYP